MAGRSGDLLGRWISAGLPALTLVFFIVILWEVLIPILGVSKFMVARPSEIAESLRDFAGLFLSSALVTSAEIFWGFLLSVVVGVSIALLLTWFTSVERAVLPLVIGLQIVPKVALAPLLILWFGFSDLPKIILIMLIAFFPITMNMRVGLNSVSPDLLLLMRSVGASKFQVVSRIRIPTSLPYLFAGLRIAVTFSVIGAVVAEFAGANQGLGYLIQYGSTQLDTPLLFGGLVVISAVGFVFYYALSVVERIVNHWYPFKEV
jgi:NitT/TauT family transport system permease protein